MNREERLNSFRKWQETLSAYRMALTLIGIDANAKPPSEGASYRGSRRAVLMGEYQRVLKDEEMFRITEELAEDSSIDGDAAREVELVYTQLMKNRAVPAEVFVDFERVLDVSKRDWLRAKTEADFRGYAPKLKAVIDGYREITELRGGEGSLYDRMLDDNQPGWNEEKYDRFFETVKEGVIPLLYRVQKKPPVNSGFLHQYYPAEGQRRVMEKVIGFLGYTDDWGKLSESEHPLTTAVCRGDIRFTTKYREKDAAQAILSTVHECGHAWFGHNIEEKYEGTAIAGTISAGLHESQSRLFENHIGRSLSFWRAVLPWLAQEFPKQLEGITAEAFYQAVNEVKPSLIRTEADELTYPLHILIRYELEKELMGGSLEVSDLEEAWNEKYRRYLGIVPSNAAEGVLQDMHWPYAYFGYFPTYALGSAIAAQIWYRMKTELDVEKLLTEGRFGRIPSWLGEKLQHFGNRYPAEEVIKKACGEEFNADYYLRWLEEKYG